MIPSRCDVTAMITGISIISCRHLPPHTLSASFKFTLPVPWYVKSSIVNFTRRVQLRDSVKTHSYSLNLCLNIAAVCNTTICYKSSKHQNECQFTHITLLLDPETGPQWTFFLLFFLVLISDFWSTKAFSFHNRSSSNFTYRLVAMLSTVAPWRIFKLSPNYLQIISF